ncbi:chromosome-associated kinesin KIF4 isoform X2 [Plutella xylostella]|uniref:chromosome-associated kinesin KIF4 isoform X1 n=1 Tax=Plutella xylostella TaxID=51655 RepID=UPI0020330D84|nr:chromosome-associated kinesin KIF4 isoform X1 [Plutella xylostella]XP_048486108.1 chromosome-associated kinesin KIF4 isoform X2 [Plutella xylostella]
MVHEENGKETIDTVQVALRIRPLMPQETSRGCEECITTINGQPQVQIKDLAFTYNYVFAQHITQQEFYDTAVKGLINKLFQGYNVTILAYGQTGSGKTYTMGTNYSGSEGDCSSLGVIPLAVADIFDFIEAHEDKFTFKVTVSFMELYQEQCYDLLSGKERTHSVIEIREDVNKGVVLPGISELPVGSTTETMKVLEQGSSRRVTGSTAMNQASSRSHAVFTIVIAKESRADKNLATTSKFHLVDLAGSERIKKTKASGERLKEGVKINQGLLALGNVISALGDGTNRSFISYRDSKLTRLLQDSLGGNSLTLMVACVSPADYNLDETVSTLRYADRARRIRNKPVINQDARAAEILRLNNLVNELRLQLLGKLPTPSEQNNEHLQEELEKEKAKYSELLKKHKQVTDYLGMMLIENTNLCEKALLAEAAKDKIERKLNELTEQCNQTIENLNTSEKVEDNEMQRTCVVDYLKDIKTRLEDLQSVNLKTNEELIDHEIKLSFVSGDSEEKADDDVAMNEDQAVLEEEKRAMGQVALNQELQELNRAMAIKASVVQAIMANNKEMLQSHAALREDEERMQRLERERDDLIQQLSNTKNKDQIHEERRSKVSKLEQEISELKKKCQQQASIIRTKEKNEAKIASLNAELQSMKSTKVKIIRQMREESEKFRKWKQDNERAMLRLRTEERKRATAMAKMESLHAKQQNVLKRKMEEAVAVNKRLKEALDKQRHTQVKRNAKGNLKVSVVQQYVEQELEVHLSVVEAERSLEELMEYRAWITEQLERLRNSTDEEANRKKMQELEDDLALRKAQISDLQQKIITADQENKSRTQWDNIQSMLEAKVALKCMFELLVDAKRELANQSEKGYQAKYEEIKEAHDRLALDFENCKSEFERQLTTVKVQSEQKLTALVALQRGMIRSGDRAEACKHLQNVIQYQQERLEQVEEENKKLAQELEEVKSSSKTNKKRGKKTTATEAVKRMEYIEPTDEEEDDFEDSDNDPDWRATPVFKRIQAQRSRLTMDFSMAEQSKKPTKRGSDGSPYCVCRGSCSTNICGCVKSDRGCGGSCKCQQELCKNRRLSSDTDDKENQPSSGESVMNATPSYFDKRDTEKYKFYKNLSGIWHIFKKRDTI